MWFHSQNLNEDELGKVKGSIIRHGRCWLHLDDRIGLSAEWSAFRHPRFGADIGLAHYDCALSVSIQFIIGSIHFHLDHYRLENWIKDKVKRRDEMYGSGREIGFRWHDGAFWLDVFSDPMEWRSKDPWYLKTLCIDPRRILLGSQKYSEIVVSEEPIEVAMPEAVYYGTCKIVQSVWKRPRWPWSAKIYRAHIDIPKGIPHPGKGENAWDCGENATFGITCRAKNTEEGVVELIKSVLRSRKKYGGASWRPETVR